jgi:hypothetical protein
MADKDLRRGRCAFLPGTISWYVSRTEMFNIFANCLPGGGILAQAKKQSSVDLGQNIITAGLCIQVLFFGIFIMVAGIFHWRISRFPTTRSQNLTIPWAHYLWILYGASLMIMIRSVFRIVEYVMGQDGVLLSKEIYLYIFDATLMFIMMALFNIYHPSKIIRKAKGHHGILEFQDEEYPMDATSHRGNGKN